MTFLDMLYAKLDTYRKVLRLTKDESIVYGVLLDYGPMTAAELSDGMEIWPQAVYRLTKKLVHRNFITMRPGRPTIYEAVPLQNVLWRADEDLRQEHALLQANLLGSLTTLKHEYELTLISGRDALYATYAAQAKLASREILVFAIGIAYDIALHEAHVDARARGVEIRHIVQQRNLENLSIITHWLRIGVKMRHHPTPLGFHLMVFDGETVIMTFSNPADTEQRTSMLIRNAAAAQTMRKYFYGVWGQSRLIK